MEENTQSNKHSKTHLTLRSRLPSRPAADQDAGTGSLPMLSPKTPSVMDPFSKVFARNTSTSEQNVESAMEAFDLYGTRMKGLPYYDRLDSQTEFANTGYDFSVESSTVPPALIHDGNNRQQAQAMQGLHEVRQRYSGEEYAPGPYNVDDFYSGSEVHLTNSVFSEHTTQTTAGSYVAPGAPTNNDATSPEVLARSGDHYPADNGTQPYLPNEKQPEMEPGVWEFFRNADNVSTKKNVPEPSVGDLPKISSATGAPVPGNTILRKKHFSLDPVEREALENLIEDVIIGGVDGGVIDSDESSSSEAEESATSDNSGNKGETKEQEGKANGKPKSGESGKSEKTGESGKVYPAQLKVAVKHMKNLPPRFLRRLQGSEKNQDGTKGGAERKKEISRQEKANNQDPNVEIKQKEQQEEIPEKEKSRSKEEQKLEKKKKIRGLLEGLDTYIEDAVELQNEDDLKNEDEAEQLQEEITIVKSPIGTDTNDDLRLIAADISHSSPPSTQPPDEPVDSSIIHKLASVQQAPNRPAMLLHHNVVNCEDLERELLQTQDTAKMEPRTYRLSPMTQRVNALAALAKEKAAEEEKKSQFSVDAPEFVPRSFTPVSQHQQQSMGLAPPGNVSSYPQSSSPYSVALGRSSPQLHGQDSSPPMPHMLSQDQLSSINRQSPVPNPAYLTPKVAQSIPTSHPNYPSPGLLSYQGYPVHAYSAYPGYPHQYPYGAPYQTYPGYGTWPIEKQHPDKQVPLWAQNRQPVGVVPNTQVVGGMSPADKLLQQLGSARPNSAPSAASPVIHPRLPSSPLLGRDATRAQQHATPSNTLLKVKSLLENNRKVMIILRGCPGSGKSTMAKQLVFGGEILTTDEYFMRNGIYDYDYAKIGEAHEWNQRRAKEAIEAGKNPIVIDNTNTQAWEMKYYISLALKFDYDVEIVEPDTQWKFMPKELAQKTKHGVPVGTIRKMLERYDHGITVQSIMSTVSKTTSSNKDDQRSNKTNTSKAEEQGGSTTTGNNTQQGTEQVQQPLDPQQQQLLKKPVKRKRKRKRKRDRYKPKENETLDSAAGKVTPADGVTSEDEETPERDLTNDSTDEHQNYKYENYAINVDKQFNSSTGRQRLKEISVDSQNKEEHQTKPTVLLQNRMETFSFSEKDTVPPDKENEGKSPYENLSHSILPDSPNNDENKAQSLDTFTLLSDDHDQHNFNALIASNHSATSSKDLLLTATQGQGDVNVVTLSADQETVDLLSVKPDPELYFNTSGLHDATAQEEDSLKNDKSLMSENTNPMLFEEPISCKQEPDKSVSTQKTDNSGDILQDSAETTSCQQRNSIVDNLKNDDLSSSQNGTETATDLHEYITSIIESNRHDDIVTRGEKRSDTDSSQVMQESSSKIIFEKVEVSVDVAENGSRGNERTGVNPSSCVNVSRSTNQSASESKNVINQCITEVVFENDRPIETIYEESISISKSISPTSEGFCSIANVDEGSDAIQCVDRYNDEEYVVAVTDSNPVSTNIVETSSPSPSSDDKSNLNISSKVKTNTISNINSQLPQRDDKNTNIVSQNVHPKSDGNGKPSLSRTKDWESSSSSEWEILKTDNDLPETAESDQLYELGVCATSVDQYCVTIATPSRQSHVLVAAPSVQEVQGTKLDVSEIEQQVHWTAKPRRERRRNSKKEEEDPWADCENNTSEAGSVPDHSQTPDVETMTSALPGNTTCEIDSPKTRRRRQSPRKKPRPDAPQIDKSIKEQLLTKKWDMPSIKDTSQAVWQPICQESYIANVVTMATQTESRDLAVVDRLLTSNYQLTSEDQIHCVLMCRPNRFISKPPILNTPTSENSSTSTLLNVKFDKSSSTEDLELPNQDNQIEFLQNCFPALSVDDLEEILNNCNGDTEWAVNILLDAGYEYNVPKDDVRVNELNESLPHSTLGDGSVDQSEVDNTASITEETAHQNAQNQTAELSNQTNTTGITPVEGLESDPGVFKTELINCAYSGQEKGSAERQQLGSSLLLLCYETLTSGGATLRRPVQEGIVDSSIKRLNSIEEFQRLHSTSSQVSDGEVVDPRAGCWDIEDEIQPASDLSDGNLLATQNTDGYSQFSGTAKNVAETTSHIEKPSLSLEGAIEDTKPAVKENGKISSFGSDDVTVINESEKKPRESSEASPLHADDVRDASVEEEKVITLTLTSELARQLIDIFGPIAHHPSPDTMCSEDLRVKVDASLAQKMHTQWTQSLQQDTSRQQASMAKMIEEDEALARRLQEEEQKQQTSKFTASAHPTNYDREQNQLQGNQPVSLRDIMEEETVIEISKKEFMEKEQRKSQGNSLSTRLKRNELIELFPNFDRPLLEELFKLNRYSLDNTIKAVLQTLESDGPPQTVMTAEAAAAYEDSLLKQAINQSLMSQTGKRREVFAEEEDYDASADSDYQDFRSEVHAHRRLRQECYEKAKEIYRKGWKSAASFYAEQGHLHTEKLKEAKHKAAKRIMETRALDLETSNRLDLHGLYVDEALCVLQEALLERHKELERKCDKRRWQMLVVTGRGNHSHKGVARIKPAMQDYLKRNNYAFSEAQPGVLKVTVHR